MKISSDKRSADGLLAKLAAELHCLVPSSRELLSSAEGPLAGEAFVVKDLVAIEGHISSFGHPRWRDTHKPSAQTAELVHRLRAAGASLVGISKMDQLAYSLVGNVGEGEAPVNPASPERFTGGSSSGSASAVAGELADIGIGTDTAGSIRVPAAACGLFGIRPTHGAIDSRDVIPLAQSFDVVGILTRSAPLMARTYQVLAKSLGAGAQNAVRVLIPNDALGLVEPDVARMIRASASAIAKVLGCACVDVPFAEFIDAGVGETLARLQGREIWENHSRWIEENGKWLAEDVRMRLDRCRILSAATDKEKATDQAARRTYVERFHDVVGDGGIVVIPVMRESTPLRSSTAEEQKAFRLETFRLVAPGSLCGAPQVVVPVFDRQSGRGAGISLLGPRGSDLALLSAVVAATGTNARLEI